MDATPLKSVWNTELLIRASREALLKLHPRFLIKNPVMFLVAMGAAIATGYAVADVLAHNLWEAFFNGHISLWLWFTVLFSQFAEALAEGRGKAQAEALRKTRTETKAQRLTPSGELEQVNSASLRKGDRVVVIAGNTIPADGTVVDGIASVDESAVTGESAPVIREAGGDRSAVTGGTRVLSDRIVVEITTNPGESFLDRMISLVEGANRQKTPNEVALQILIGALSLIFLAAVVTLYPLSQFVGISVSPVILVALLVCLIPTTIGGLLSAIGIAGMDRLVQRNVLATSGRAVEAAGDVDVLLLDKTGTITMGNRMAHDLLPLPGVSMATLAHAAYLASSSDLTPRRALHPSAGAKAWGKNRVSSGRSKWDLYSLFCRDTHEWSGR